MNDDSPRKFDHDKPQINLIPGVALIEMGKVLAFGAKKYDRGNWAKGLATSRYLDAAYRHVIAYNAGEDRDPESGLLHLAHAAVNMCFAIWNFFFRKDLDDRWDAPMQLVAAIVVPPPPPIPAAHVPKHKHKGFRWFYNWGGKIEPSWRPYNKLPLAYISREVASNALEAYLSEHGSDVLPDARKDFELREVEIE